MANEYWDDKNKKPNYWESKVTNTGGAAAITVDGLQQFMMQTYTWMSLGLAITGAIAVLTASSPAMLNAIFGTPLFYVLIFAELGLVFAFSMMLNRGAAATTLMGMFLGYAALNGVTMASIFLIYTSQSIAQTFFISAGMFGGMSLYGYTTKRDLTGMGNFMIMGLWGIILAGIVNLFVGSSALSFGISVIAVIIFTGLTAYDTQKLKAYYHGHANDAESLRRVSLGGALMLYLDFINLFLHLLRLLGRRR